RWVAVFGMRKKVKQHLSDARLTLIVFDAPRVVLSCTRSGQENPEGSRWKYRKTGPRSARPGTARQAEAHRTSTIPAHCWLHCRQSGMVTSLFVFPVTGPA